MLTSFCEICEKEIINTLDGSSFGFAGDIIFDSESRKIAALVVKGKRRLFGREEDFSIGWDKIETVGKDTILVKTEECSKIHNEKVSFLEKFFNFFLY
jgi:YlmC/YmxH family sporulation protein